MREPNRYVKAANSIRDYAQELADLLAEADPKLWPATLLPRLRAFESEARALRDEIEALVDSPPAGAD